jgi:hypothetical protein
MRLSRRHGLQLADCPFDPKPDKLPVEIAAFEHLIGTLRCDYFRFATVLADQQVGGSPDVAVLDHSG